MVDAVQFSSWLVVALFFIGAGALLSSSVDRSEFLADRWERISDWLAAHGRDELDEDEVFARAELREVMRAERLHEDLLRIRHLVATDTYMSATRQLGNRIAYRQLLAESQALACRPELTPPRRTWAVESADLSTTRRASGPEHLDIGWR